VGNGKTLAGEEQKTLDIMSGYEEMPCIRDARQARISPPSPWSAYGFETPSKPKRAPLAPTAAAAGVPKRKSPLGTKAPK
jgi:hypothetical protein